MEEMAHIEVMNVSVQTVCETHPHIHTPVVLDSRTLENGKEQHPFYEPPCKHIVTMDGINTVKHTFHPNMYATTHHANFQRKIVHWHPFV